MSNTDPTEKPLMHLNDFVEMWQKALSDQAAKIADLEKKLAVMTKERDELAEEAAWAKMAKETE